MPALVHRRISPRRVGSHAVFHEATPDVIGLALEHHPHAEANVVRNRPPVAIERGHDFDLPLVMQLPAFGLRPHHQRQVFDGRGGIREPLRRRRKPGCIAHCGGLDRRLRAVEKRVEHLRVESAHAGLLGREAVVAPYGFRRGLRKMRQPFVAAPGRDHRESRRARPIDEIADDRRLITVGEAVHDARLLGFFCEQRPAERIRLNGHHHHVLAVSKGGERMLDRRDRIAGGFDDDLHRRMRDERTPILRDVRPPLLQRHFQGRSGVVFLPPAHALQAGPCIRGRKVRDTDQMHTRRLRHLRDVHGAEFARADHADPQRLALRFALLELCVQIHAALSTPCSSSGGVPSFHGSGTSYCLSRQSSGRHFKGAKSRCAMYPGRLKRRMWFDTAHKLR